MRIRGLGVAVAAAAALVSITASAGGPIFTPGNIVVFRAGNGVALSNLGNPIFLDEYTTAGSLVQSVLLPTTTSGANRQCVTAGNTTSEGLISLSTDGQYIVGACYASDIPAASSLTAATAALVPRVLFRVSNDGSVNTTTALTDFGSAGNPRSAASTNGTDLWGTSSNTGVHYAAIGSTTSTQLAVTPTNLRQMGIAGGQLLVSANTGAFRLASVGSGTPTMNGQTITNLTGLPTATVSPYGFVGLDRSASVAGIDTIYFADDRAAPNGGIYKYSFDGATWTARGFIAGSLRGLTGKINGANVVMYATGTAATANTLVTANDTALFDATILGTITAIGAGAPVATAFRGVAFVPQPAVVTPTLTIAAASVTEGNVGCAGGTTAMNFTVTSSSAAPVGGINFTFGTTDITASAASDFSTTGAGTIAVATTTGTASVLVNCDNDYEENETFTVTLIDGATYDLGATFSNTGTIINDDPTPYVVAVSTLSVQELNSLAATGTSSSLPTGYAFSETGGNATYSADDGSSASGGVYSYGTGSATERALGTLRDGTVTPFIGMRLQNGTGDVIKYLWVQYAGEQWRRDSATATPDRLDFQYSTNATSLADPAATWTDVDALDFASPITSAASTALDGNAAANRTSTNSFIETLNVANNATFWIRWADADAAGNDDGLAIDSVSVMVPTLDIEAADSLTESNIAGCPVPNNLRFTVGRSGSVPSTGIPYTFTTTAVSATQNIDYTGFTNEPKTLNFGGTVSFIDVPITCDDTDESDETFTVTIATVAGSGYFVLPGSSVGTATIVDDDVSGTNPNIAIGDLIAVETNTATTSFSFPVTLSAPAVSNVTFTASTSDGSATTADNDYIALVAVAGSIPATQTSTTVTVTVNGDYAIEGNENFTVTLAAVTNVAASGNDLSATGTISNDDSAINIAIQPSVSIAEGNSGSSNATITVQTNAVPIDTAGISYTTVAGSASAGSDYTTTTGSTNVTCAAGPALPCTASILVPIIGDLLNEGNEVFTVTINTPTGTNVALANATSTVTITNDDVAPLTIEQIQGTGHASPSAGQTVTTIGNIVTAVLPAPNGGFIMQMKDADASGDTASSNGIFVFSGATPAGIAVGDEVNVRGGIVEFNTSGTATAAQRVTEFTNAGLIYTVTSSGNPLPAPITLDATVPSPNPATPSCGAALGNFECFESMRVTTSTGMVNLGNQTFGSDPVAEMWVTTSGQRAVREGGLLPIRATETVPVLTPAASPLPTTYLYDLNPEVFELDMDRAGLPNDSLVPGTTFSATGVLVQEFGQFELFPTAITVNAAAPALPAPVANAAPTELTIGSQNLHLLFDDVNDAWNAADCTAADVDFCPTTVRWNAKLNLLSRQIREQLKTPMVIAHQEIEKLGALQALANKVNLDLGPTPPFTYTAYVGAIDDLDGGHQNVGYLIRSDVTVLSLVQQNTTQQWTFNGAPQGEVMDRPAYLLRATVNLGLGAPFEFAVMNVHQRSLSGIDDLTPLADQVDAHRVRQKRLYQAALTAQAIQAFQTTNPTVPLYVVGDFNAYTASDGYADVTGIIQGTTDPALSEYDLSYFNLEGTGPNGNIVVPALSAASALVSANERYSYQFQSMPQQIDHAMMNAAGLGRFLDIQFSRNNVDQQARYMISFSNSLGTETPLVSSDHDGFVLYIDPRADGLFSNGFED